MIATLPRPARAFALSPHPSAPPLVRAIRGDIARTATALHVRYVLDGDMERLQIPAPARARVADELWRHTCCELFVAVRGEPRYYELNFSPSGAWAAYAFARYRECVPLAVTADLDPGVTVHASTGALALEAVVHLDRLAPHVLARPLTLALSAVIEDRAGALAYWALTHPGARPDFHHPDAFVLELDEIRH